jgi:3-dehydroquinate synthase
MLANRAANHELMKSSIGSAPAIVRVAPGSTQKAVSEYEVRIGPGLLRDLPVLVRKATGVSRFALIADTNVAEIYAAEVLEVLQTAGLATEVFVFPAGEMHKSRETWMELSDRLLTARFGRDSAVLAFGGGVAGDLAGFVAATYMRGLPLVQIPTSLLAMIDSSVGGKTGVDTPAGKNLIGAFHQPRLVVADTDTLASLPTAELRSGLAEAVKHGAIADADYFRWIAASTDPLLAVDASAMSRLIRRSVEIKAGVVGADEREQGQRKMLNFGHTIGHAVEALSRFELLHGEAIAIGMVIEAAIGQALGVTRPGSAAALASVLGAIGLPTALPARFDPAEVVELSRLDKKARAGRVEYALIEELGVASPGTGSFGTPVPDEAVLDALVASRPDSPP